jgi:hypothetical protein
MSDLETLLPTRRANISLINVGDQGCENPWLFFEAEIVPPAKILGNTERLRYITAIYNYVTDFYGIQIPAIIFKIQEYTNKYTILQY